MFVLLICECEFVWKTISGIAMCQTGGLMQLVVYVWVCTYRENDWNREEEEIIRYGNKQQGAATRFSAVN